MLGNSKSGSCHRKYRPINTDPDTTAWRAWGVVLALGLFSWHTVAATLPEPISAVAGLKPGAECPDAGNAGTAALAGAAKAAIPLKVGLTLSSIWKVNANDYEHECLAQVAAIDARGMLIKKSCPIGAARELKHYQRRVCWADFLDSSIYLPEVSPDFPETFVGSLSFSLSIASFVELKAHGSTMQRYIQPDEHRQQFLDTDIQASFKSDGASTFKLIVNDKVVEIPTIEAASIKQYEIVRIKVLDEARFPLLLDYYVPTLNKFFITITKVSYPTDNAIEHSLTVDKHTDVYGIYFDFASATLRAESEPVLHEIADVLRTHIDWRLQINGHTDNIGSDAQNLELSRQRAAAVRAALMSRFQIDGARLSTNGLGASQPKESNETVSGRARNRRVELVRQ
jgi:outer membrane protein OmpA-like peptidoglycan-associated protein